jgi:6-phosphogluconolactonase
MLTPIASICTYLKLRFFVSSGVSVESGFIVFYLTGLIIIPKIRLLPALAIPQATKLFLESELFMSVQIIVKVFPDNQALAGFAVGLFDRATREALGRAEKCLVSLSGGGTPMSLYRLLAQSPYRESLPWANIHFFWGDERCVSPQDAESCYQQANQAWLAPVGVPQTNIHRVKGELGSHAAAQDYARVLAEFGNGQPWPRFDLVLLGLGADGHTASLFPGSELTSGLATLPVTAQYQDRPANRVSLSADVFNSAREVVFLATGAEKSNALLATLAGPRELVRLPAQRIRPTDGCLWWLVDQAAAAQLPDSMAGVEIQR